MYKKSNAILNPGNRIPVSGTKIDGKYDAVIILRFINNKLQYKMIIYNIICYFYILF